GAGNGAGVAGSACGAVPSATGEALPDPRLRRPDRAQLVLEPVCLDDRIEPDHPVRIVWAMVEKWELSGFLAKIQARGSTPGRPAGDPRLVLALWRYAYIEGIGCGRELNERCVREDPYKWLCGGVSHLYGSSRTQRSFSSRPQPMPSI